MTSEVNVIWRKGDNEIPEHARRVVSAAKDELLFESLQLPAEIVDIIRYNADKNAQTINNYIATILTGHFRAA